MIDPLDLTLRQLLERVLVAAPAAEADPLVDPDESGVPRRQLLAAAKRDEIVMHKVGRRLFVRRSELQRWLERPEHRVVADIEQDVPVAASNVRHILEREGFVPRHSAEGERR